MNLEIVYVLTNPAMPGFVKIGKTAIEDVQQRLSQLYTSGVPFPFELQFACKVRDSTEVEAALHRAFAPYRVNPKREFFKIEPEQAMVILKLLHVEDATEEIGKSPNPIPEEDLQAGKNYSQRRPPMNFTDMGIPMGAELHFTEGNATVCVTSDRKVRFGDDDMSLTAATRVLLGIEHSVQPSPYWTYNGRSLIAIYNETYQ